MGCDRGTDQAKQVSVNNDDFAISYKYTAKAYTPMMSFAHFCKILPFLAKYVDL